MTIRRRRIACWVIKATNTHSEYVTLIAFPRQQWLHERASRTESVLSALKYSSQSKNYESYHYQILSISFICFCCVHRFTTFLSPSYQYFHSTSLKPSKYRKPRSNSLKRHVYSSEWKIPNYITKSRILEKKKSLSIKWVFWVFFTVSSLTFLILGRTGHDVIKNVYWPACKYLLFLSDFNDNWIVSTYIGKI